MKQNKDYPINLAFAKPYDLTIADDENEEVVTLLVFDKKANKSYWDHMHSFSKLISDSEIDNPSLIEKWTISKKFIENPALLDILSDFAPEIPQQAMAGHEEEILNNIYGAPIEWADDEKDFVTLTLNDGKSFTVNFD